MPITDLQTIFQDLYTTLLRLKIKDAELRFGRALMVGGKADNGDLISLTFDLMTQNLYIVRRAHVYKFLSIRSALARFWHELDS